jgi:Arc/MetJ-type ribon-helix-helix transcriptional regulator
MVLTERMMGRMTDRQIIQARMSTDDVAQLDADRVALGLATRSDAIREGLRLLHRQARHTALARDYDDFYGHQEAPLSDLAAMGDIVAAEHLDSSR